MNRLKDDHPDVYDRFCKGLNVVRRTNKFWAGVSCDLAIEQTLMRSVKSTGGLTRGSKMSEHSRMLWVLTRPCMSAFNESMQSFTNKTFATSDQHKEAAPSSIHRDTIDTDKLLAKLNGCSPFSMEPTLRNIVNGMVANDDVNVLQYQMVAESVISQMKQQLVFSHKFKRKERARTLADASAIVVAPDRSIDPGLLFQICLIVSQTGSLSLEEMLTFELSPFPPSLFEGKNLLRKADKPQLLHTIIDQGQKKSSDILLCHNAVPKTDIYVFDGGSLIHRLPWKKGELYHEIITSYCKLVRKYASTIVVFDGYGTPTTKDITHLRRGKADHLDVKFDESTVFDTKKEKFLSNTNNKQRFINMLGKELESVGVEVIHAPGDADVLIATTAINAAKNKSVTLIGEDTDLLILLLHHTRLSLNRIIFRSDKASATKATDIIPLKKALGSNLCSKLLFCHALTGCDTTSRIYGVGKKAAFKKLLGDDKVLSSCAKVFTSNCQTKKKIEEYGRKAMVALFGGSSSETLLSSRRRIFNKKVAGSKSFVGPERLPPTDCATDFHSQRVYLQIMTWSMNDTDMVLSEWGWKEEDNRLVPQMTTEDAAPPHLLKMIHCNCKTGCGTPRCGCRRYGLQCTSTCGSCQLEGCENCPIIDIEGDIDDDESDDE